MVKWWHGELFLRKSALNLRKSARNPYSNAFFTAETQRRRGNNSSFFILPSCLIFTKLCDCHTTFLSLPVNSMIWNIFTFSDYYFLYLFLVSPRVNGITGILERRPVWHLIVEPSIPDGQSDVCKPVPGNRFWFTGQSAFYTDGTRVYDRTGLIMPNGSDLLSRQQDQSVCVVQNISDDSLYYIFT